MKPDLAISALLLAVAGCASAKIDADRGDIAVHAVEHENPVLPLTVAVASFEDRTGRRLPKGEVAAFTRSYVKVLRESRVFLDAWPQKGAIAPADLKVRGAILEADLHRNYAWIATWGVFAVATLGYGTVIGPALGLPWASDTAGFALEVRVETADGARIAAYRTDFHDTLYLTAYSGDEGLTGYAEDPRRVLEEVVGQSVRALIDDGARYRALALRRQTR
jgi:hypothetical protein